MDQRQCHGKGIYRGIRSRGARGAGQWRGSAAAAATSISKVIAISIGKACSTNFSASFRNASTTWRMSKGATLVAPLGLLSARQFEFRSLAQVRVQGRGGVLGRLRVRVLGQQPKGTQCQGHAETRNRWGRESAETGDSDEAEMGNRAGDGEPGYRDFRGGAKTTGACRAATAVRGGRRRRLLEVAELLLTVSHEVI